MTEIDYNGINNNLESMKSPRVSNVCGITLANGTESSGKQTVIPWLGSSIFYQGSNLTLCLICVEHVA